MRPREKKERKVYFFQCPETLNIKIGVSNNPEQRRKDLSTARAHELKLLGTIPGDERHEHALHKRFSHIRVRAEWFKPERDLLEFINHPTIPEVVEKPSAARSRPKLRGTCWAHQYIRHDSIVARRNGIQEKDLFGPLQSKPPETIKKLLSHRSRDWLESALRGKCWMPFGVDSREYTREQLMECIKLYGRLPMVLKIVIFIRHLKRKRAAMEDRFDSYRYASLEQPTSYLPGSYITPIYQP